MDGHRSRDVQRPVHKHPVLHFPAARLGKGAVAALIDGNVHDNGPGIPKEERIKVGSPKLTGKNVIVFCTYSGPHTGINEAIPAANCASQYFEHLGFTILDELYVIGEFHGSQEHSTMGRLGDIRGRPNEKDLADVRQRVRELLNQI